MTDFRWYVKKLGMSGVAKANNEEIAKEWIYDYIVNQFANKANNNLFNMDDICVWNFTEDDDFNSDYPDILAVSY